MRTPLVVLKAIAKAAAHYCLGPEAALFGTIAVDMGMDIADNAWKDVSQTAREAQGMAKIREEMASLIQMSQRETLEMMRALAPEITQEVGKQVSEQVLEEFALYLSRIPGLMRQTMRRLEDPSGRTVRRNLKLEGPGDLMPYIPQRSLGFQPGDRPLKGLDYHVAELLGTGGFGEVWRAEHTRIPSEPPVALKFCTDPMARDQLLNHEAVICSRVKLLGRHDHIVTLLQTFLDADPPFLMYEYVEGGDLAGLIRDWYQEETPPDKDTLTRIVLRLARTAAFTHGHGIVHRDLKPANILVTRVNGKIRLKVADYGIGGIATTQAIQATRNGTAPSLYQATVVRGAYSALYSPREQMNGQPADPRDDVYALGMIWYQVMVGDFTARPEGRWKQRLIDQRKLTAAEVDLMEECFEPAEHRIRDGQALAERLERALRSGGPTVAAPQPAPVPPSAPKPAPVASKPASGAERATSKTGHKPTSHFTNSLGMTMVPIEPGTFVMGSTEQQIAKILKQWPDTPNKWLTRERPEHQVRITQPFSLAAHLVTVGQFRKFVDATGYQTEVEKSDQMGFVLGEKKLVLVPISWRSPGFDRVEPADDHPVVYVSHEDALAFLNWLNEKETGQGRIYRLPTEAEWEYACRAGTQGLYGASDDPESLVRIANVEDASYKREFPNHTCIQGDDGYIYTAPVGRFAPNAWGLYDMIGNVWELCADGFDPAYYAESPLADPAGPSEASNLVVRGGSWCSSPAYCRPAYRNRDHCYGNELGFRLASSPVLGPSKCEPSLRRLGIAHLPLLRRWTWRRAMRTMGGARPTCAGGTTPHRRLAIPRVRSSR